MSKKLILNRIDYNSFSGMSKPIYIVFFALLILFLNSCSSTKYLKKEESFLSQNIIKFPKDFKIEDNFLVKLELGNLIKQKPNKKTQFGINKRWYFYNNWWAWSKSLKEDPAIFDEQQANQSLELIKNYFVKKGFFHVEVSYEDILDKSQKFTKVYYDIKPGRRFILDSIYFQSEDSIILPILNDLKSEITLKKGSPVDSKLYDESVNIIYQKMIKLGYAAFNTNYILPIELDTFKNKTIGKITVEAPVDNNGHHRIHYISNIKIYPNYSQGSFKNEKDSIIDDYHFITSDNKLGIKSSSLLKNIYFKSGEKYDKSKIDKTAAKFNTLDIYKITNIRTKIIGEDKVDVDIILKSNKKYEYELNSNIFLGNNNTTTFQFGSLLSLNYRIRNINKTAAILSGIVEGGGEIYNDLKFSSNFKISNQFTNPNFTDYFYLWSGLKKLPFFKNFYTKLRDQSYTQLNVSYDYVDQLNIGLYKNHQLNLQYGYNVNLGKQNKLVFNHFGIDLIYPAFSDTFKTLIDYNEVLKRSFGRQFYSGLFLRNLEFYHTSPQNAFGEVNFFKVSTEICGVEAEILNNWFPLKYLSTASDSLDKMEVSRFLKVELEYRYNRILNKNNSLAFRALLGIAKPFGTSDAVPYNKQFFVGGPNSIRAWKIKALGPGAYRDIFSYIANYQTGDLKLELNGEYRFTMLRFSKYKMEGAFFLDAGNVWLLNKDPDRENAEISSDFWKQIAVGTGFGARFDFNIFLIRFDLGLKLYDPNPEAYIWIKEKNPIRKFSITDLVLNLAVNYPF